MEEGLRLGGEWNRHLLKLAKPRQAREYIYDAHHLRLLELVVLQTAGRPKHSPSS
jgi:hypothetical protein